MLVTTILEVGVPSEPIILPGTILCGGKVKPKMNQSADAKSRHHARVGGPETDVQTLHLLSYATADVRLHFFAAK